MELPGEWAVMDSHQNFGWNAEYIQIGCPTRLGYQIENF
jgi:hypothetical protein